MFLGCNSARGAREEQHIRSVFITKPTAKSKTDVGTYDRNDAPRESKRASCGSLRDADP